MLNFNAAESLLERVMKNLVSPEPGITLPWWPRLTQTLGGLRMREMTLLCAPTGSGKTQLLANISAQLLLTKVPHFCAPVETGDTDFVTRILSVLDRRNYNTNEKFSIEEAQALFHRHAGTIRNGTLNIATYENYVDVEEMANLIRFQNQEYGCKVALLDNLNFFMKVTRAADQLIEMDSAVREFVMLCKEIPVHVILIVHPKKTDGVRVESEFDIKGSSTAVQECANVLLWNRPKPDEVKQQLRLRTDREAVFHKIRKRGEGVGLPIWFAFNNGRFEEFV